MDNPVVTEHSIKAFMQAVGALKQGENTSENGNENRLITNGQYLYTIYSTNSYKCTLTMMGCPWVQPLMYFCLLNMDFFSIAKNTVSPGGWQTRLRDGHVPHRAPHPFDPLSICFCTIAIFERYRKSPTENHDWTFGEAYAQLMVVGLGSTIITSFRK